MTADRADIRVHLVSNPLYLSGVRELVGAVAHRLGLDEESCAHIKLAVDEALCNVMRHGYGTRPDGPIWLNLWPLRADGECPGLRIVIEDEARQIDPDKIKGRPLDEIRPGGLGVHIIQRVMDQVTYEKRGDAGVGVGMRLTMVRWGRPAPAPTVTECGCAPDGRLTPPAGARPGGGDSSGSKHGG